ncbi:MAG: hypothetical protein ACJ79R_23980 [Anaeromyxobacteraceae bacterium]
MGRRALTWAILLVFFEVAPLHSARADGRGPACSAPIAADPSRAAVYDEEEPQQSAPPETNDPSDDQHPWQPHDESYSPFDGDDEEEELQA